jgi:hypothetical protein
MGYDGVSYQDQLPSSAGKFKTTRIFSESTQKLSVIDRTTIRLSRDVKAMKRQAKCKRCGRTIRSSWGEPSKGPPYEVKILKQYRDDKPQLVQTMTLDSINEIEEAGRTYTNRWDQHILHHQKTQTLKLMGHWQEDIGGTYRYILKVTSPFDMEFVQTITHRFNTDGLV